MKSNIFLPFLLLLTILFESKAQQGISIANESEINTSFQEYSPAFYQGGLVFITSNPTVAKVKQSDDNTGKGATSIFLAKQLDNGMLSKPLPFAESLTTSFYDGPLCFNTDGTTVYFTRSNLKHNKPVKAKDGLVKLKIYSAQLKADKWENIVELPFNNKEYDFSHPSVSPDGRRLYFASNRPGGFGGMDLYVVTLIDNKWSEPVNLGPKVNTSKDEVFPFIHADGKVFYSSNGRAKNVGGLDVYFTAKTDTGWLMPQLLPEPINSRSDDFGLILSPDKMSGYYSSNRSSGKGDDDIYSFHASQVIDSEFITNNELSNINGGEIKNNSDLKTDSPVGEVKSIEKSNNNILVSSEIKPIKDTVSEVKTQVEESKKELVKLDNPIVESSKIDVPFEKNKVETVVERAKVETVVTTPITEPIKEVLVQKEEPKVETVVERAKVETVVTTPVIEPIKEVLVQKEEPKVETVVERAKVETVVTTPVTEPIKEVLVQKEEPKVETLVNTKVEATVSTPIVEPVKETISKIEIATPTPIFVEEKTTEIKVVETTPSVTATISDNVVVNTVEPNKIEEKNPVSANVKNEITGSVRCKYLVVVGTYAAEKNAIIQQKIVKNKGFADVEVIHYKDRNLYGVCVKQSNDEKEAYSVAKTVVKSGIDAFVKVLK
jgi:WD40-like Beta Propeller Repeat